MFFVCSRQISTIYVEWLTSDPNCSGTGQVVGVVLDHGCRRRWNANVAEVGDSGVAEGYECRVINVHRWLPSG